MGGSSGKGEWGDFDTMIWRSSIPTYLGPGRMDTKAENRKEVYVVLFGFFLLRFGIGDLVAVWLDIVYYFFDEDAVRFQLGLF